MSQENTPREFDQARAKAFASKLLGALNQGPLCLMMSVGHRTGLFDAMKNLPPATSDEIAARAALNEPYVREWLGAMVTARVIEFDPATMHFALPTEHAAFLTRASAPDNAAVVAQFISVLGAAEDAIVESFEEGGGVPYSKFPRFHQVMRRGKRAIGAVAAGVAHPAARDGTHRAPRSGHSRT
jgi:hypothetical protein